MQAVAPATAKFQLAVPHILGSVSPGLAALHAARARRLHPADATLRTTHCPACGAGYLDGGGEYRSVRSNDRQRRVNRMDKTPPRRSLHMLCGVCGHREELPIEPEGASSFVPPRKRRKTVASNADIPNLPNANAVAAKSGEAVHARSEPKPAGLADSRQSQTKAGPSSRTTDGSHNTPATIARSKARLKKSTGLQNLLARNREKQEQEKKATGSGLSAFLQDLG
ncbi:uncharacterized protein C8Q71DRAFT_39006 [Rhodofomes roseus]|uniref:Uncharacterized protein n=1 Tax=Rhodofomes roseus TaxID=34475 RepID=A0ABQ8KYL4_9APHY|nr:uncharacterized protein C8Q71DRAFT_39006 [Rhodofomes roseus]KAH9844291.1 hypothetical protein C8Q71DRAFT_39006 [Rhodofomes roseus]